MLEKLDEMQRLRLVYLLDGLIRGQELSRAQFSKQISGRFSGPNEGAESMQGEKHPSDQRLEGFFFTQRSLTPPRQRWSGIAAALPVVGQR